MIGCCEIAVVLAVANVISLAVFAGYTVKIKEKQLMLEKEVKEVERVNGREKRAIEELQKEVAKLKEQLENHA